MSVQNLMLVSAANAEYVFRTLYRIKMNMKYLLLTGCLVFSIKFASAQNSTLAPVAAPDLAGDAASFSGKVLETTNTAGYTYVLVDTGTKKLWAAAVQFEVKVGDKVKVASGMPMANYHSKSLNRDFDLVYFTGSITPAGDAAATGATPALPPGHPALPGATPPALPPGHPALTGATASPNLDLTEIKRADGGKTVQEIFAAQSKLAGKPVAVRGKVVKYNAQIMGKNWLHIQDGSGSADKSNNDLTITTATPAKVGDTVLVTGTLSTNKDFGAGYKYAVIIEDAKVTVE